MTSIIHPLSLLMCVGLVPAIILNFIFLESLNRRGIISQSFIHRNRLMKIPYYHMELAVISFVLGVFVNFGIYGISLLIYMGESIIYQTFFSSNLIGSDWWRVEALKSVIAYILGFVVISLIYWIVFRYIVQRKQQKSNGDKLHLSV